MPGRLGKPFYLLAVSIGGFAWEAPGHIWYESLLSSNQLTQFQEFADTTYMKAGQLYGTDSAEQQAAADAWREVGIRISGTPTGARGRGPVASRAGAKDADLCAALAKQIQALAAEVKSLAKDIKSLKEKK